MFGRIWRRQARLPVFRDDISPGAVHLHGRAASGLAGFPEPRVTPHAPADAWLTFSLRIVVAIMRRYRLILLEWLEAFRHPRHATDG